MTTVGFDIETGSVDDLYMLDPRSPEYDYVRLVGWVVGDGDVQISTNPQDLIDVLNAADIIYGHGILNFDLQALCRYHGADYWKLAAKCIDTLVVERTINPPYPKAKPGIPLNLQAMRRRGITPADLRIPYSLDETAARYGVAGKTDNIKELAAKHGGFHLIPQDDPEYRAYLKGDVISSRALYRATGQAAAKAGLISVVRREIRIAAIQNGMRIKGLGVDRAEVEHQIELAEKQRQDAYHVLHEKAGVPLPGQEIVWYEEKEKPIPRTTPYGKRVRHLWHVLHPNDPCPDLRTVRVKKTKRIDKSPLSTNEGRNAFEKALKAAGVKDTDIPFTLPTKSNPGGKLALSKDALGTGRWVRGKEAVPGLQAKYPDNPAVKELCEAAILATSTSGKAEEVMKWLSPDGRVHSQIGDIQASGRWAHIKASITNIGKRGKAQKMQRRMFRSRRGFVFICIDLDQVDARAVAGWCQDPEYRKMALPGMDMHYETAKRVFGVGSCNDCRNCAECSERRSKAKANTHSWNYGQGVKGLAASTGLPLEVCETFDKGMKRSFPVLCAWKDKVRRYAERTGVVPSKWGRPLRVIPGQEYTQAPAQIGQSTTRDLLCDGLIRLQDEHPEVLECLVLVIHDEIVLEVPENLADEYGEKAMAALTTSFEGVPITCGRSPAASVWAECYD